MKKKFNSIGRVAIALVLALSLTLVMAVPVAAQVTLIEIDSPTGAIPAYVAPGGSVDVDFSGTAASSDMVNVRIQIAGGVIGDSGIFTVTADGGGAFSGARTVAISMSAIEGEEYDLTVKTKVGAQDWQTATELSAVIVDSVDPTVTIDDIAAYANPTSITGTASDAASGVDLVELTIKDITTSLYWDGSSWTTEFWLTATNTDDWATWSYDSSGVSFVDGKSYTVKARATDVATNVTAVVDQPADTFTADIVVPAVFITTTVVDPTSVVPGVIEGTANDALSGVQKVEVKVEFAGPYYWDGSHWVVAESWVEAVGTTSWSFAVPTLTSGRTYTVTAKSTDNANNESTLDTLSFTYDAVAPTVTITAPTDEGYYKDTFDAISGSSSGATPAVEVVLKDDTASLYWDGDSWEAVATWLDAGGPGSWSYNVEILSNTVEADGEFSDGSSYTVTAKATDDATPANAATAQATFTYDIGAPAVTIDDIADYVVSLDEITGTASDAGSGVDEVHLTIKNNTDSNYWTGSTWGGSTWLDTTNLNLDDWATWEYDSSGVTLEDGKSYTVTARATDDLSLTTDEADQPDDSFTLDTLPVVGIDDIADPDFVETLDSIAGTASDDVPGAVTLVQLKIENTTDSTYWTGAAWGAETWLTAAGTDSWSYDTSGVTLEDGKSYTVTAKSQDNVGQWSDTVEDSFACDTAAPTVSITDLPAEISPKVIAGTTSDAGSGVVLVELTIQDNTDDKYWDGGSWEVAETWLTDTTSVDFWGYDTSGVGFAVGKSYTVTARATDNLDLETAEEDYASETFTFSGTLFSAYDVALSDGWNLVSLPLIPTVSSIDTVLAGADATINKVAYYTGGPAGSWLNYISSEPGASDLTTMSDGKGYWIDVSAGATTLTATGVALALPGQSPPTYDLVVGWNLIGFTSTTEGAVAPLEYLGPAVIETVEAMYRYDAASSVYEAVTTMPLEPGEGYWLAVNAPGKIYP